MTGPSETAGPSPERIDRHDMESAFLLLALPLETSGFGTGQGPTVLGQSRSALLS
jgi:hypothetical protein